MKAHSLLTFACGLAGTVLAVASCKKDGATLPAETGAVTLRLENGVRTTTAANASTFSKLVLDAATYQNANGDSYSVSTFKYYLSNVKLLKADNSTYSVPDSYFLVDQAKPESQTLTLTGVPLGDYTGVAFTMGVDSARTKAGGFTGELNANNGMFWDMNGPEFINLKLEGRSPQSPSTGLVFHLAGYKSAATNTIRTVTLPFPATKLPVRADRTAEVYLQADIARLFTGPNPTTATPAPFQNPVSFATIYNKMGGPAAAKLADNAAAGMFSVDRVQAN